MGNSIVIPSFQDWYAQDFKKMGITGATHLESGTFFMVFKGKIKDHENVIKAYEYNAPLSNQPDVIRAQEMFQKLQELPISIPGIAKYSAITVEGTTGYLARPFFSTSLEDLMTFQQPPITNVEKTWIAFQIVTAMTRLHQSGLSHYDLKPSNVFVEQSFFTYVTDLAPFKPKTISPNRMNFYYHFFTTNSSSGYYLAPERFSNDPESGENIDMKAADLFSLGCVLYFIFSNGKHLFDVTSGMRYGAGKLDVTEKINQLPKKSMRSLILRLISLDPKTRLDAEQTIISNFPEQMKIMSDIFRSFSLSFENNIAFNIQKLVEIMDLGAPKYKMIIIDYMNEIINYDVTLDIIDVYLDAYLKCLEPLPDDVKIIRAIPALALLIERFEPPIVHKMILESLISIMKSIHTVPVEFRGIFTSFLNPLIEKSCKSTRSKMVVANFVPHYACELERLAPMTFERVAIDFSYITTNGNYDIFKCYIDSLISVSKHGFRLLNTFLFPLLSTFNFVDEKFKTSVIRVFIAFYTNAAQNEVRLFGEQCNESILPVCQDLLGRTISDSLLKVILQLLNIAFARGMADKTFGYALLPKITEMRRSKNPEIRYEAQTLIERFPRSISSLSLLDMNGVFEFSKNSQRAPRRTIFLNHPGAPPPMPNITPHFMCSFREANAPIRIIESISPDRFVVVQGESKLRFLMIQSDGSGIGQNRTKMLRSKITSMANLSSTLITGLATGDIETYDINVFQKTHIIESSSISTSITTLSDNTFICTFKDGSVVLYDTRVEGSQCKFQFKDIIDITSSTRVNGADNVAAVGFSEGAFALIDARVMEPVWLGASPPVRKIVSLDSPLPSTAFAVISDSSSVVVSEPLHNVPYTINVENAVAAPYKGGAAILSCDGAWYMHISGCLALYDGAALPTDVISHRQPLSIHTSQVLSANITNNLLISGDASGFVNFSILEKPKRN